MMSRNFDVTMWWCHGILMSRCDDVTEFWCHEMMMSLNSNVTMWWCHGILLWRVSKLDVWSCPNEHLRRVVREVWWCQAKRHMWRQQLMCDISERWCDVNNKCAYVTYLCVLKVKETSCALHLHQRLLCSLKCSDFLGVANLYYFNRMLLWVWLTVVFQASWGMQKIQAGYIFLQ